MDKRKKHAGGRRNIKLVPSGGAFADAELELETAAASSTAAKSNGAAHAGGGDIESMAHGLQQVSTAAELTAEQLSAQADEVAAEYAQPPAGAPADLPPDPNAPPVVSTEDAEKGYRLLGMAVVGQSALLFAPAWHVTLEEQTSVSDAIVQALMIWFPGGLIPAKYLALLVLASAVGTIAISRIDPVTGELPPRHAPVKKPVSAAPTAAAGAAATHIQPSH